MARKQKRKNKRNKPIHPALTLLDKRIYILCIVLSVSASLGSLFGIMIIQDQIAFADPQVVAFKETASVLFAAPFVLYLEISAFAFFISRLESQKPIFGNKNIRYGEPPYAPDCLPLFGRAKYGISAKPVISKLFCMWLAVLLLLACLIPLSLFGRTALYRDNHIERINLFNQTTEVYTLQDSAHLTVSSSCIKSHWEYWIEIKTKDGKTFSFSCDNFKTQEICLDKMLEIKSRFSLDRITVTDADTVHSIAEYKNMTDTQRAKLYELFGVS